MKNLSFILIMMLLTSCGSNKNTEEWVSLFNGKDLEGWTVKISGYPLGENFNNTFSVEDGVLIADYSQYQTFNGEFGHIFYKQAFSSYKLRLKYRFTGDQIEGGPAWAFRNSGVMLHCQDPLTMGLNQDFPVSIEAQFLGGNGLSERNTLNLCTPGTNVVMNNKLISQHCITSTSQTYHGDQWVETELVVYADSILYHIVNGDTVISYSKPQIGGGSLPEDYYLPEGTPLESGYISLQAESHRCEYKEIEILEIK